MSPFVLNRIPSDLVFHHFCDKTLLCLMHILRTALNLKVQNRELKNVI